MNLVQVERSRVSYTIITDSKEEHKGLRGPSNRHAYVFHHTDKTAVSMQFEDTRINLYNEVKMISACKGGCSR